MAPINMQREESFHLLIILFQHLAFLPCLGFISSQLKRPTIAEAPSPFYVPLSSATLDMGEVHAWHSRGQEDDEWDGFLESTELGQFQQSSPWGHYKQSQGWQVSRVVLTLEDRTLGGFQILWKSTRLGRIGYVSKGPVIGVEAGDLVAFVIQLLHSEVNQLKLQALVVQPPDFSHQIAGALARDGFLKATALNIIEASCILDLTQPAMKVEDGFSASARRNLRIASKAGVVAREGTPDEISVFYDLMAATCVRRGVAPNPPTREAAESLWAFMSRRRHARLAFSIYRDEIISGKLCILFGRRISLFKVGWNGQHAKARPNEMLAYEVLTWAKSHGYALADWVGMSRETALAALEGKKQFNETRIPNADLFKMRFGGRPVLLPSASVWINNPLLRQCYRLGGPAIALAKAWRRH